MGKHKFVIEPHFRLQEWIAEEKGYFKDENLDYVFQELTIVEIRSARCSRLSAGGQPT